MSKVHVKTNNNQVKAVKMNNIDINQYEINNEIIDNNSQYLTEGTINHNIKFFRLANGIDDIDDINNIEELTKLIKITNNENNNIEESTKLYEINNEIINNNSLYLPEETINNNFKFLKSDDIDASTKFIKIINNNNNEELSKLDETPKRVSKFFNYENDDYENDDLNPFNKSTNHELTDNNITFDFDDDSNDPFAKNNSLNEINNITAISKIEIWVEIRKGKKNTYVYDLELYMDIETIKAHLKKIRIAKGCNGSITKLLRDTGDIKVLQLQGNHKDYMGKYLIHAGIDSDLIYIKGE